MRFPRHIAVIAVLVGACSDKGKDGVRSDAPDSPEAPGTEPAPAPAPSPNDEFVSGGTPAPITGANLAELNVDNARLRCDFVQLEQQVHRILCRAAVVSPNGSEFLATSIALGTEVSWPSPSVLSGKAEISGCAIAADRLSQTCDTKLLDLTAKISLSLDVRDSGSGRSRVEKAVVLLPYSVGVAAGFVGSIPYLYLTGADDDLELAESPLKKTGMQSISVPADRFRVAALDVCASGQRLYINEGSMIRVLEDGKISHFAGSPDIDADPDYSDRRRIALYQQKIQCDDDGVYVTANPDEILKLKVAGPVEVVAKGLGNPNGLVLRSDGEIIVLEFKDNRIVKFKQGKYPESRETLVQSSEGSILLWFAVNDPGEIMFFEVTHSPVRVARIMLRAVNGDLAEVQTQIPGKDCGKGFCADHFMAAAAHGSRFLARWTRADTFPSTLYELSTLSPPKLVHGLQEYVAQVFSTKKDLVISTGDRLLKVGEDSATTLLAGRDSEEQISHEGKATESQFVPSLVAMSPKGEVLIYDEDMDAIRVIDGEGGIKALNDLRERSESIAPVFADDGSVLFVDSGILYKRPATGDVSVVHSVSASFPDYVQEKEDVASLVRNGDDLYAVTYNLITKRKSGGAPVVVVGLKKTFAPDETVTRGEGKLAATHGSLNNVQSLAVGKDGSLYFIDLEPPRLRRVDPDGILTTIVTGNDEAYSDLRSVAVANDGTLYVADGIGTIDLFVPDPAQGAGKYRVEPFLRAGVGTKKDCGTGRVNSKVKAESVEGAIRASLSVMCIGTIRGIAIDDTCPAEGGRTRIMIAQEFVDQFSDFGNLIEVISPCR